MINKLTIGESIIGSGYPVFVIAEIGINHEGDVSKCDSMIEAAAKAGADAVKLQTVDAEKNYVKGTESYEIFKGAELSKKDTASMFCLARSLGLEIFTTLGDFSTADWINDLNPCAWKISSGLLTHLPLIEYLAKLKRPILMSTGLANLKEIDAAVKVCQTESNDQIGILHCTSLYPTPINEINLSAITSLHQRFTLPIGYSDHTLGTEAAFLAVGAGAQIIEKHLTFDRTRKGFDHHISLDKYEFTKMIKRIRIAEKMIGTSELGKNEKLIEKREANLRCLVASKLIEVGEVFTKENIAVKRPLSGKRGLLPKDLKNVLNRKSKKHLETDEPITKDSWVH